MAYRGYTAELPFGHKGMIRHDNRLLSEADDLLDADNVFFADDYVAQAPIRRRYGNLGTVALAAASWTGSRRFAMCALSLQGVPAIAAGVQALATTQSITGPTNTFTVTTTTTTGRCLVAVVGYRTGALDIPKDYTLSDSKGNSWIRVREEHNHDTTENAYWVTQLYVAENHTSLVGAVDTITATFEDSDDPPIGSIIAIVVSEYTNINTSGSVTGSVDTNGKNATSFSRTMMPIVTAPQVIVAVSVLEQKASSAAVTAGSGFTLHGNVSSGSGTTTSLRVFQEYRILASVQGIQGLHDFWSGTQASFGPITSITVTQGSQTVTGVGSTFTGHAPGDQITVNSETQVILSITSDTVLTTIDVWRTSAAPTTYQIVQGNRLITASSDRAIFKEKPLTMTDGDLDAVTLVSGLTAHSNPTFFVEGGKEVAANNKKLFIFDGVNRVHVLSGDGATAIPIAATKPADWDAVANPFKQPIGAVVHQGRLVGFGNLNDPFRMYFSTTSNHEDFTAVGTTFSHVVRSDVGQRIYCAASIQGVLFTWLYPRGIFYLNDEDLAGANWSTRIKSVNIGCAPSPYAVIPLDDDALFMAADGSIHMLSAVEEFGGFLTSDITRSLGLHRWMREHVNLSRLDQVVSVYDQYQRVAYFGVPSLLSNFNDMVLKFDFGLVDRGGTIRFSYGTRDHATGLAVRTFTPASISVSTDGISGGSAPLIGENGYVDLVLDPDTFGSAQSTDLDTDVVIQTPHLDFAHVDSSLRFKRKNWQFLEIIYEQALLDADSEVTVEVYVDQELRESLELTLAATANTLRRYRTALHCGDGYTISLRVLKNIPSFGNAAGLKLTAMLVGFEAGDESQARGR